MFSTTVVAQVQAILGRYFDALEGGQAHLLQPYPYYAWRYYNVEPRPGGQGEMSPERIRSAIGPLDEYLNAQPQHNWAERNHGNKAGYASPDVLAVHPDASPNAFDTGPGLGRLPDAALLALAQELDALFFPIFGQQELPAPPEPMKD